MPTQQNVNSPAKAISDNQLTYDYLVRAKHHLVEVQRMNRVTTVTDAQIAAIDAQILEARALLKFGS